MNKKDFYSEITTIVKNAISERNETQKELDEINAELQKRNVYAVEQIQNVLRPAKSNIESKMEDISENANIQIKKVADSYIKELSDDMELKSSELTDDIKLLSVGVKLNDNDLIKLYDKHSGNYTMQRYICDYATQNGITINRVPHHPNKPIIDSVGVATELAGKTIRLNGNPSFYEQFMGENSQFAKGFCD